MWDRHDERLERMPEFQLRTHRRRRLAFAAHPSTTGVLADLSFAELHAAAEAGYATRRWPPPRDKPPDAFGNYAARAYRRALTLDAGQFLGPTSAATVLLKLDVSGSGYRPVIPPALSEGPAPTGPTASSIVGYFDGTNPAGRRTWQAWRRRTFRSQDADQLGL
jgi:hypothetical protein